MEWNKLLEDLLGKVLCGTTDERARMLQSVRALKSAIEDIEKALVGSLKGEIPPGNSFMLEEGNYLCHQITIKRVPNYRLLDPEVMRQIIEERKYTELRFKSKPAPDPERFNEEEYPHE